MIKHTPGPWKHDVDFHLYEKDSYSQIVAGQGFTDEIGTGFNITGYMSDADAKLITAAPNLLEACIMALPYLENNVYETVLSVINKATK